MPHVKIAAVKELEKSIATFYGECVSLNEAEFDAYKSMGYANAWKVELRVAARIIPSAILIDHTFPFSSPRIAILGYENFSPLIPHIGGDGLLCLGETGYNYFSGQTSIKPLICAAYNLIENGLFAKGDADFQSEFLNYWNLGASKSAYACVKHKDCLSTIVYVLIHGEIYFFEDEKTGRKWLTQCFGGLPKGTHFRNTMLVPIEDVWLPPQYPQNGHDIMEIVKQNATGSWEMPLECAATTDRAFIPILFSFSLKSQNIFVAANIRQSSKKFRHKQYGKRGVPWVLLAQHFFSPSAKVEKMSVHRIDSEWLHYRGEAGRAGQLRDMNVAILGCGSLGGQVADFLCRAGIGKVTLFDPDILLWDNIYRHILGTEYVGHNKAKALALFLEKKFPETTISSHAIAWEKHFAEGKKPQFLQFDLIISLIGDTENNAEYFLSYCSHKEFFTPVLFGWVEVWGAAGHALLLGSQQKEDGCLLCKIASEHQIRNVYAFDEEQEIKLPACSTTFAPYGFIDVAPIVSMISNLALDFFSYEDGVRDNYRIWVSNTGKVTQNGGTLNPWVKEKFGCIQGEQVLRSTWVLDEQCPVCQKNDL